MGDHRAGMSDLFSFLDKQCADRRKYHQKKAESERAFDAMKKSHSASLKEPPHRPDWNYVDPPGYFQNPMPIDKTGASTMTKIDGLMGIYDVKEFTPPHNEFNVPGMWDPHATNDRGRQMDFLGHPQREWPEKHVARMGVNEKKFFDRRNERLKDIAAAERKEAQLNTQGFYKKAKVLADAGDHSSLKRTKPAWTSQAVTTHVYFHEYENSKPGDHSYTTGLQHFVEQPVRATSFERDFIAGDPLRTTYWKAPPAGKVHGSVAKHHLAQELMCPPGCPNLSPSASQRNSPKATKKLPGAQSSLFANTKTAQRDFSRSDSG